MGMLSNNRGRKAILPASIIAALAILIAWVMNHLGGGVGTGSTNGTPSDDQTAHIVATQSSGPLQVVVHEDGYLVDGHDIALDQIVMRAAAASSVQIVGEPDSRMGAERELEKALDAAHVSWTLQAQPVPGQ